MTYILVALNHIIVHKVIQSSCENCAKLHYINNVAKQYEK